VADEMYLITIEAFNIDTRDPWTYDEYLFKHPRDVCRFLYARKYRHSEHVVEDMVEELMEEGESHVQCKLNEGGPFCTISLNFRGIDFEVV